jgi:hypothetical protein
VGAVGLGWIGEREVIFSGGIDRTVQIWDSDRQVLTVLDLPGPAGPIAWTPSGLLYVASGRAISASW